MRDIEQADYAAIPISTVGQFMAASKGAKQAEASWFNPYERILRQRNAKDECDPQMARTFLELSGEGKVPSWAIAILDIELLRAASR